MSATSVRENKHRWTERLTDAVHSKDTVRDKATERSRESRSDEKVAGRGRGWSQFGPVQKWEEDWTHATRLPCSSLRYQPLRYKVREGNRGLSSIPRRSRVVQREAKES